MKNRIQPEPEQRKDQDLPGNQNRSLPPIRPLELPETRLPPPYIIPYDGKSYTLLNHESPAEFDDFGGKRRSFLTLSAGVTPAEGSVKPTAGFTLDEVD